MAIRRELVLSLLLAALLGSALGLQIGEISKERDMTRRVATGTLGAN